jgi:Transglutaminase-like superfamily
MQRILLRLTRLPRQRRKLIVQCAISLAIAWAMVRLTPYRMWKHRLGRAVPAGSRAEADAGTDAFLRDVTSALDAVNRNAGGRFTCLMLALAGRSLLDGKGIASILVLGVALKGAPAQAKPISAHAWLMVGDVVVTGANSHVDHVPVAHYGSSRFVKQSPVSRQPLVSR